MNIQRKNLWSLACIMAFLFVIFGGCASREHMSPDYGVKSRDFMARQRVYEEASKDTVQGLDSEESSIIQATYRKNMGGQAKESKDSDARVLIVEESKKDGKN